MESAHEWLEAAGALSKTEPPNHGLGPYPACTALTHLAVIQAHSVPQTDGEGNALISIAVEHLKILSVLVKIVVVYGFSAQFSAPVKAQLQSQISPWILPLDEQPRQQPVDLVHALLDILKKDDDVAKQILISPWVLYIVLAFSYTPHFDLLTSFIPTLHLMKLLLQLMIIDSTNMAIKRKISAVITERSDGVRILIELTLTAEAEIELGGVAQIALILVSPVDVPTVKYIESVGTQLFALFQLANLKFNEAAALIAQQLSDSQPKLVGKLRNMVVQPLVSSTQEGLPTAGQSLTALFHLASMARDGNRFVGHLIERTEASVWLLTAISYKDGKIPEPIVATALAMILAVPAAILGIVKHLILQQLPGRLEWSIDSTGQPQLIETVGKQSEPNNLMKLIDSRLECLLHVVCMLHDNVATKCVIALMQAYVSQRELDDPIYTLLLAKSIEVLSQDDGVKQKLFDDPSQIIEFAYSIIAARQPSGALMAKMRTLDVGDSDDEAEEEENNTEVTENEKLLDLALSLMGTALMETWAQNKYELSKTQIQQLKRLAADKTLPKSLRARADFCCELVSRGSRVAGKNLDESASDADVLRTAKASLAEPLVPSRAYGMHLIALLAGRKAIPLKDTMDVFLRELGDDDSYIYLNALKGIEAAAKSFGSVEVIEYLLPLVSSDHKIISVDTALRAREAVIRLLTPRSRHIVSSKLVDILLRDLTHKARSDVDFRFRLSSASILGIIIAQLPLSINSVDQREIADCVLGILRHETDAEDTPMRRSAAVLALEVINAVNENKFTNVPSDLLNALAGELQNVVSTTKDETLREHCKAALDAITPTLS